MVMLAFVDRETGWIPCQVSHVKCGDSFYLVCNGKQGPMMKAIADPRKLRAQDDESWVVDAKPLE